MREGTAVEAERPWMTAATNLRLDIPSPRPKVAKPAKSWRTLKPGDVIVPLESDDNAPSNAWKVMTVNSEGANLLHEDGDTWELLQTPTWKELYRKVPKKRAKKKS
jgi:hypothetical protein